VPWQWVATGLLALAVTFGGWIYSGERDRTSAMEAHQEKQDERLREVERSQAVTDSRFAEILRRLDELRDEVRANRPTVVSGSGARSQGRGFTPP
jgi:hypothetical protein